MKSPEAAPFVLIAIAFYYAFRLAVEWYQSDVRRRAVLASRVDAIGSLGIATVAFLLFCYQRIADAQLADSLKADDLSSAILGFLVGNGLLALLAVPVARWERARIREERRTRATHARTGLLCLGGGIVLSLLAALLISWPFGIGLWIVPTLAGTIILKSSRQLPAVDYRAARRGPDPGERDDVG